MDTDSEEQGGGTAEGHDSIREARGEPQTLWLHIGLRNQFDTLATTQGAVAAGAPLDSVGLLLWGRHELHCS